MAAKRLVKRSADANKITLGEAFADFKQEKAARSLAYKTLLNYEQSFNFFCRYAGYNEKTPTEDVMTGSPLLIPYAGTQRGHKL